MKNLAKKIQAGALQYTLFIAVLVVLLLSGFILLTYIQNQFKLNTAIKISSIQYADIGFTYAQNRLQVPYGESSLKLEEEFKSELTFHKKSWGIFDVLKVASKVNNDEFLKVGLLGGFINERPALYLKDNNKPLVVVGNTRIEGKAFLPMKYIKRGNIAGRSYYQKQLLFGSSLNSTKELPKLVNKERIEKFIEELQIKSQEFEFLDLYEGINEVVSFLQPTKYYTQNEALELKHISLAGNIIIHSNTSIIVDGTCKLSDVILIAPYIQIKEGFIGNMQAIATAQLMVDKNCMLKYPSAFIVIDNEQEEKQPSKSGANEQKVSTKELIISEGSSVSGIVAYFSKQKKSNYDSQIKIAEKSQIRGEVYCEQNLELYGDVLGSVYSNNFITKQFGSVYQNHIYNGKIISKELPTQYVGMQLEGSKSKVVKWLY